MRNTSTCYWHQGDKPIVLSLAMKIAGFAIPRMAVGVIPITSAVKHGESMPQGFTPCIAWAERNGSAPSILSGSTGRNAVIGTFGSESLPRWRSKRPAHNWDCTGVIRFISRSRCVARQCNPQLWRLAVSERTRLHGTGQTPQQHDGSQMCKTDQGRRPSLAAG